MESAPQIFNLSDHLPESKSINSSEIEFTRISTDATDCSAGDLYIAIVTADGDGHHDFNLALENGAVGILAERLLPTQSPLFIVDDTRTAFSQLSQIVYGDTDSNLVTIAVTGSTAVTSTATLLQHTLCALDLRCELILGDTSGTPQEAFLAQTQSLKELASRDVEYAIVELTPEQLASRVFDTLTIDYLVITGVEEDESEFDGTQCGYESSYRRAFNHLSEQGVAVLNFADPVTRFEFLPDDRAFLSVGQNEESDVWAQHLEHGRAGQTFRVHAGDDQMEVFSPILGHQHVFNCLQAIAIGLLLDLPFRSLCFALQSYENSPGQLQRISLGQPFDVYVDHANTSRDLNKAVLALRQVTTGRLIVVYGPSASHTPEQRSAMGRVAEKFADVSIITENHPEYEDPLAIAHDVIDGYNRSADAYVIPGRERAIGFAITMAEPGDTVLVAGKGADKSDRVGKDTYYFDDVEIATICIQEILNPVARYGRDIFRFEDYTGG